MDTSGGLFDQAIWIPQVWSLDLTGIHPQVAAAQ